MIDSHAYNITIRRDIFEGEACFEARVKELPDLTEYADTYEDAYQLAIDAIETTAEIFKEKGQDLPLPQVIADDFSGRITLRLPKSLHRAMVEASDQEGLSLNQYVVNVLSYFSGYATGLRQGYDHELWRSVNAPAKQEVKKQPSLKIVYSKDLKQPKGWKKTG